MEVVDFLIITALVAETKAVLQKLPKVQQISGQETDGSFFFSTLPATSPDGAESTYNVVVVPLPRIGNISASTTTTRAIVRWKPTYVILVGVAAGIAQKVDLGDILIADSVLNFETQKSLKSDPIYRTDSIRSSPVLLSAIRQYAVQDKSWKELLHYPELLDREFRVHTGSVLSGDKLFMGEEAFERLKAHWPTLIAADMEASGVAEVISSMAHRGPDFLVVRSVSDFAEDRNKTDIWVEYAADIAASFVIGFIASRPVSPRKGQIKVTLSIEADTLDELYQRDHLISVLSGILSIDASKIHITRG